MNTLWARIKNSEAWIRTTSSGWTFFVNSNYKTFSLMVIVYGRSIWIWIWPVFIRVDSPWRISSSSCICEYYRLVDVKKGWIQMVFHPSKIGIGFHMKDSLWGNWGAHFGPLAFNRIHLEIHSGPATMDLMDERPLLFIPRWRGRP